MKLSLIFLLAFNLATLFLVPLLTPMIRDHIGAPVAPARTQAPHATQPRLPVSVPYDPDPRVWHALLEPRQGTTTPLMAAVTDPSGRTARALLKTGAEVNQTDIFGVTPLMWAAAFNPSADGVRMLIQAGSEVNACDDFGNTALVMAARYGRSGDVVRELLDSGSEVNAQNDKGLTPLMAALGRGGRLGWFFPTTAGDMSTVPQNLIPPTEENSRDAGLEAYEKRWTDELARSSAEVFGALIGAGADTATGGWLKVVEIERASDSELTLVASTLGALVSGRQLERREHAGMTPLMKACEADSLWSVRALIGAGACVDAVGDYGLTALMRSCHGNSSVDILETLVDAGADVNVSSESGYTALMYAAGRSSPESVRALLQAGANAGASDKFGWRAVDYAKGNADIFATPAFRVLAAATSK